MSPFDRVLDVPVRGGAYRVAVAGAGLGSGAPVVLAVHGVTFTHRSWAAVARHLGDATVVAVDLRGRGANYQLPGPYGWETHVEDLEAVSDHLNVGPVTAVGHSMGTYVVLHLAARAPHRVGSLVLVDAGLGRDRPPGIDPELAFAQSVESMVGPDLARFRERYASRRDATEFWRRSWMFRDAWNDDIEALVQYELTEGEDDLAIRVNLDAVRADVVAFMSEPARRHVILEVDRPVHLVWADGGVVEGGEPIVAPSVVAAWRARLPALTDQLVTGTNHELIVMAARESEIVAGAILRAIDRRRGEEPSDATG